MFKTIVWATDGSVNADHALPIAKAFAAGEGHSLVAVHCKELLVGRAAGYPVRADEDELVQKIQRQVAEARQQGFAASLKVITAGTTSPARVIADTARAIGADVIVVGTRGQSAVVGLLGGSVTQRLLHVAPCPVLAVPPAEEIQVREPAPETVATA